MELDLFKQEGEFVIEDSLGVETTLPLAPALILYGPNNSGKTNTVLAILSLMRGEPVTLRDVFRGHPLDSHIELSVRLELEREDHRQLLYEAVRHAASLDRVSFSPEFYVGDVSGPTLWVRDREFGDDSSGQEEEDEEAAAAEEEEEEEDSEADALVQSLRAALLDLVAGALGSDAPAPPIVDLMLRCARLRFAIGGETQSRNAYSSLRFDDPRPVASADLDPEALERVHKLLEGGLRYDWGIPSLVDVVSADDLEQLMSDPIFAMRVLEAFTGWERTDQGETGIFRTDEWARVVEDESDWSGEFQETREDPWFDDVTGLPVDEVVEGCARVSELATHLAPAFVTREYRIELQPLDPRWWYLNEGRRLRVALVPHTVEGSGYDGTPPGFGLGAVGAGHRIWATFAVYEALRQLSAPANKTTVYVFDEPERHLHPAAQREAASFVSSIVREDGNVILATHAPAFLNEPVPNAFIVRLFREDGKTKAAPLDGGRLAAVERNLEQLGLTRADLLQLTRGVLLVEGSHDRLIVESFFPELGDEYIRVLILRGTDNALALIDADLLRQLGVPIYLMLDNTSRPFVDEIRRNRLAPGKISKEEKTLAELAVALRATDFRVKWLSLDVPDIVWTLPDEAIRSIAPDFPGWGAAKDALDRHKGKINPKDFLEERYGIAVNLDMIRRVLSVAHERGLEPSAELKTAIASAVESTTSRS